MISLTDKYARVATERRTATSSGENVNADWTELVSIQMPNPASLAGRGNPATFAFKVSPANGDYPESIMFSATSARGRKAVCKVDAAFVAAMSEIDWAAICEACEKRARLSEYKAPSAPVVAAPVASAPVVGGIDTDDIWAEPVTLPRINRWKGNDSLEGMRQHLQILQPNVPYSKIERLTPDRAAAREIQRKLEERGIYGGFEII